MPQLPLVPHFRPTHSLRVAAGLALALAAAGPVLAQGTPVQPAAPVPAKPEPAPPPPPPKPGQSAAMPDGPAFDVTSFVLRYPTDQPDRPQLEEFANLEVPLGFVDGVFVAPREGAQPVTITVEDLTSPQRGGRKFSVSAINSIGASLVKELNARGVIGVLVVPAPDQIDPDTLADLRGAGNTTLTMDVWTRAVSQIRTLGAGERWSKPEAKGDKPSVQSRTNNKVHDRIRDNSPLQPGPDGQAGDLLRKDSLDDYLYRLNRRPGRRVDAAIAAGDIPGEVVLDYIVTENIPWTVYFQLSNTGTQETNEWLERFGLVHNQLMNRDDTLTIDVTTAGFTDTNGIVGSYDAPLGGSDKLRYKVYGTYSNFNASDVGLAGEDFTGANWTAGAEISYNVWQRRFAFLDLYVGARWDNEEANNEVVDVTGDTNFLIPYIGARFDRINDKSSLIADVRLEANLPDIADTSETEANELGRYPVDINWTVLKGEISSSFYLEPLIHGAEWSNPDAPYRKTTLAHEIALSLRGQYSFGSRLIPTQEITAGGLYSVRGYQQSIVAGDNGVIASAEYRYHLPRARAVTDPTTTPFMGKPFRWAPDQRYGRPDWDLIFKGFVDAGYIGYADQTSIEETETLLSTGLGIELSFMRNFNVRVDWGIVLHDAGPDKTGDSRVNFVGTILY